MAHAVVIGAGHNGMVAALRLKRLGWDVTVLEKSAHVGGLAAGATEGVAHDGWLPHTRWVLPEVAALAGLSRAPGPPLWGVRSDGSCFSVDEDPGWRAWTKWASQYRSFARSVLDRPAPRLRSDGPIWPLAKTALNLRRLGERDMMALLRIAPLSAEDALADHIDDPAVRAVAAGAGLLGSFMGPLSPTGAALLLLDNALAEPEVDGGGPALVAGLAAALANAGIAVRTSCAVTKIRAADGVVDLVGGEQVAYERVVCTLDPRSALLDLVPAQELPVRMEYQAQEHRVRGLVAVVHLSLNSAPEVAGQVVRRLHSASHPHDVERAFDAGKRGVLPDAAPVLLRASADGRRATVWVHGVPKGPRGVDLAAARTHVLGLVLGALERVWPGARDAIDAHSVHLPDDLAREQGLAGGHLWHGEQALDQLWSMRPGLDLSGASTPMPGVFLGGAGSAPCGGLTGRPGWFAAEAIGPAAGR